MKTKTIQEFMREHRAKLDAHIRKKANWKGSINNDGRYQWILNDEDLYRWAKSEGVKV